VPFPWGGKRLITLIMYLAVSVFLKYMTVLCLAEVFFFFVCLFLARLRLFAACCTYASHIFVIVPSWRNLKPHVSAVFQWGYIVCNISHVESLLPVDNSVLVVTLVVKLVVKLLHAVNHSVLVV
jgi:hypothetical protein